MANADAFLKITAGLALVSIGGGIGFYYGIHLPRLTEKKEIIKERDAQSRRDRYNVCISVADQQHSSHWDSECELLKQSEDCALPPYASSRVERFREEAKERCMEEFKAGV